MVWNFLIAVFFLFIPPYGWIITLLFFLGTILYYATGADLLDQKPEREISIRVTINRTIDDDGLYADENRITPEREQLAAEEASRYIVRDSANDLSTPGSQVHKEKLM